ncbi:MAG: hypothetical protein OQK82_07440 [Candidatus Pacearchaeota archaeon]|nr:hypothetical protein [Candidatus Pacearchaeota archaeon]
MLKSKKAISGIITAVIMIALVMAATAILWGVVNNIVNEQLDEAGSCFDLYDKVTINNRYTCHNTTSDELRFSINVGDIDLSGLLVSVSGDGDSKSFKLTSENLTESYLFNYPNKTLGIALPEKNSGKTFILDLTSVGISKPDLIQIAPIVGSKQCEVSDTLTEIDNCLLLVYN